MKNKALITFLSLKFLDFWQLFVIPGSNFLAFYEHNRDRPKCKTEAFAKLPSELNWKPLQS